LSQIQQGIHKDEFDGIHPDLLNRYYGIHGRPDHCDYGQTGAGHPEDDTQEAEDIAADQNVHIRHDPIEVPEDACPPSLRSREEMARFRDILQELQRMEVVPSGLGVSEQEWGNDGYPDIEVIKSGRGGKELHVQLPFVIWWPRAVRWAQGLELMCRMTMDDH
ncbi:hypothetical protein BD410DRAFT_709365, partial [Rickenella mellea]